MKNIHFLIFPVFAVAICALCASCEANKVQISSLVSNLFSKIPDTSQSLAELEQLLNSTENFVLKKYMQIFNKTYTRRSELFYRSKIFEKNVKRIIKSKIEFSKGRKSYSLGINRFTDLSDEELVQQMSDKSVKESKLYDQAKIDGDKIVSMPLLNKKDKDIAPGLSKFDWRDTRPECVLAPHDQGKCGSCFSFTLMSIVETMHCLKTGKPSERLSTQMMIDCGMARKYINGCRGANLESAWEFLRDSNQVALDRDYPYVGKEDACLIPHLKSLGKVIKASVNGDELKLVRVNTTKYENYLATYGPLPAVILVPGFEFHNYEDGIFIDEKNYKQEHMALHVMTLVGYGYDEDLSKKYWVLKNSFGTYWGEGGYIKIERGVNAFEIEHRLYNSFTMAG